MVLEDAFLARGVEGVGLAAEVLARLDGGDARVADEAHGIPSLDRHEKGVGGGCYRR